MSTPSYTPLTVADCQDFYDNMEKVYSGLYALGKDVEGFSIRSRYTRGATPNVLCAIVLMSTYLRESIKFFQTARQFADDLTHYGTWYPTRSMELLNKVIEDIPESNRIMDGQ